MKIRKYRGLSESNKWFYGYFSKDYNGVSYITTLDGVNTIIVKGESISQFTGVCDMNDNEIYEGDKLSNGWFIEYIEDRCRYVLTSGYGYDSRNAMDLDCDEVYTLEIIGNIYE